MELADGRLADGVADARPAPLLCEEGLVVVAAVNRVVVQQSRNAAEAYQAEGAVGNRAGRQQRVVRPAATVDRQVVYRDLVDVRREVLLLRVDDGGLARHLNCLRRAADREVNVERGDAPDLDDDLLLREGGEARGADGHGVVAGLERGDAEAALVVGRAGRFLVGFFVLHGDRGVLHDGTLRVFDHAADCAVRG